MIDLNATSKEEFSDYMSRLRAGDAIRTKDDIIVRRCRDHPGFEFISPMGSPDPRRFSSVDSIVTAVLDRSARSIHGEAYGGPLRYKDYSAAAKALNDGRAISGRHFDRGQVSQEQADRIMKKVIDRDPLTPGAIKQDPEVTASLGRLVKDASKTSYKSRARLAASALRNNDVAGARTHLEALIAHAERSGADDDATAATTTLVTLRNAYPAETSQPSTVVVKAYHIRKTEEGFQIIKGQNQKHGTAFKESREASQRVDFLNRQATRQFQADEIERSEQGEIQVREKVKPGDREEAA